MFLEMKEYEFGIGFLPDTNIAQMFSVSLRLWPLLEESQMLCPGDVGSTSKLGGEGVTKLQGHFVIKEAMEQDSEACVRDHKSCRFG